MYLKELFEKISDLPYSEQQLFIRFDNLLIDVYTRNVKKYGEKEAIRRLYNSYESIEEMIIKCNESGDFFKSK